MIDGLTVTSAMGPSLFQGHDSDLRPRSQPWLAEKSAIVRWFSLLWIEFGHVPASHVWLPKDIHQYSIKIRFRYILLVCMCYIIYIICSIYIYIYISYHWFIPNDSSTFFQHFGEPPRTRPTARGPECVGESNWGHLRKCGGDGHHGERWCVGWSSGGCLDVGL